MGEIAQRQIKSTTIILILIAVFVILYIHSRTYIKAARLSVLLAPRIFDSIMSRTIPTFITMSVAAILIATVSLSFQSITKSRILTPSVIGFDSVFIGTQTLWAFMFGSSSPKFANDYSRYIVAACILVVVSLLMYLFCAKIKGIIVFLLMFWTHSFGNCSQRFYSFAGHYECK